MVFLHHCRLARIPCHQKKPKKRIRNQIGSVTTLSAWLSECGQDFLASGVAKASCRRQRQHFRKNQEAHHRFGDDALPLPAKILLCYFKSPSTGRSSLPIHRSIEPIRVIRRLDIGELPCRTDVGNIGAHRSSRPPAEPDSSSPPLDMCNPERRQSSG